MVGFSTFWVRHETGDTPEGAQLRVQQMAVIARRTPVILLAVACNAVLAAAVIAIPENREVAVVWAAIVVAMCLWGLVHWRRHRRKTVPSAVSRRGPRRLAVSATVQGLIWGVGSALLLPTTAMTEQIVLIMITGGMVSAGAMILATVPAASMGYVVACALPLAIRTALIGEDAYLALAAMMVLYVVVILTTARSLYVSFVDSVRARVSTDRLMLALSDARMDLLDAVSSSTEGFALFDTDGRLVVANDRFAQFLGLEPGKVRAGIAFRTVLEQVEREALPAGWVEAQLRHQREAHGMQVERLPGGRWLGITHRRTRKGGTVTTLIDLTAFKENEAELLRARLAAEGASRAKSEFLALMSHELRTPLNAIMGFAEVFMNEMFGPHSDPRYREYAVDIHEGGEHLLQIINDILDLSRIETGHFDLDEEPVDLAEVAVSVQRLMQGKAFERDISLELKLPGAPAVVEADARVARRMMVNLVSNALKFTGPRGHVELAVRADAGGEMLVVVSDDGIGIDPSDIAGILEPFSQGDQSLARREGGAGLGLPLVKSFIELHSGRLEINSAPGAGTTVTLHYPKYRVVPASASA